MASRRRTSAGPERGLALVTMLLLLVLVTALGLMALNIGEIESRLAGTNRRTTQSFHAAGGGGEVALPVIRDTLDSYALPTGYPATVAVNSETSGGNPGMPDLLEKLTTGTVTTTSPDVTVTAFTGQTVRVDVDYEGPATLPGSELEDFASRYHKKTGGTGCGSGNLYYVDSEASGPLNTRSRVGLAYFYCN